MIMYEVIVDKDLGSTDWYLNGKRHREDGPAIEYEGGTKGWYLNGKKVSKVDVMGKPLVGKHLIIDGVEYVLGEVKL